MNNKKQIMSLVDLTLLNMEGSQADINILCDKAVNDIGCVASICIYPKFVEYAKNILSDTNVKVATVANFPNGNSSISEVLIDINKSLLAGADEIDVVIPYADYLKEGYSESSIQLVKEAKKLCGDRVLKVIIESGVLMNTTLIEKASRDAILSGANFIKTSTGKVAVGATLDAAKVMLQTSKKLSEGQVGVKISGGVKTCQEAIEYLDLATNICGSEFIQKKYFRFGASSLVDNLLNNDEASYTNY
jgi:deoxyribose-phosphate aldolase